MKYIDALFAFLAEFFKWSNKKAAANASDIEKVDKLPPRPKPDDPNPTTKTR